MGGIFKAPKMPAPLPAAARPVTAVTKTPDLELEEDKTMTGTQQQKKKGKRGLRTDVTSTQATQVASAGSGLQIPKGV